LPPEAVYRWRVEAGLGHRDRVLPVPFTDLPALRPWFSPERPGPLIFEHVLATGLGGCRVDRWPGPRVVIAHNAENYAVRGDPAALTPGDLADVRGLVEAAPQWWPLLQRSAPKRIAVWPRIIAALPAAVPTPAAHPVVRRLTPADADRVAALPGDLAWIHESYDGAERMLAAGVAHGALVDGKVVAVAVAFHRGLEYEDIGVVTVEGYRRRGLSAACAGAVIADIRGRGRIPSWSTSPDNTGSRAVAARLGFVPDRDDVLYAVRTPVP
jgi:RimJ/RimL family protein N-acetyltransferase